MHAAETVVRWVAELLLSAVSLSACAGPRDRPIEFVYLALGASDATGVGAVPLTEGYVYLIKRDLDRRIAEKRIFPAININRSGTRREDLLMKPNDLQKMWILRKILHPMDELAAMEFLFDKLKVTKTNEEFFEAMRR